MCGSVLERLLVDRDACGVNSTSLPLFAINIRKGRGLAHTVRCVISSVKKNPPKSSHCGPRPVGYCLGQKGIPEVLSGASQIIKTVPFKSSVLFFFAKPGLFQNALL